uniref:C2orf72-like C-terminal domain-containing protein n=1 Tax=Zonotrichia albicollis TaxID=44394 RepID=A0A8D2MJC5_ZONAL
ERGRGPGAGPGGAAPAEGPPAGAGLPGRGGWRDSGRKQGGMAPMRGGWSQSRVGALGWSGAEAAALGGSGGSRSSGWLPGSPRVFGVPLVGPGGAAGPRLMAVCRLSLLPCLPNVLVLVMIRPDSQEQLDQAVRALRRMQCVLDGALQLTVETAIYSPGQPGGVLEAKKAACRALREALNCHEGNWVTQGSHAFFFFILSCIFWEEGFSIQVCLDLSLLPADDLQDPEEEVALASLSPNGNCEEAAGGTGT